MVDNQSLRVTCILKPLEGVGGGEGNEDLCLFEFLL